MTLQHWQQEAREEFISFFKFKHEKTCASRKHYSGKHPYGCDCGARDLNGAANDMLDDLLSRFLTDIEARVVPEAEKHFEFECGNLFETWCEDQKCPRFKGQYRNETRAKVLEAFREFRGDNNAGV